MDNEITIDIEEIRKAPMGSITDAETIKQIALYHIQHPNENDIVDKVDPRFHYAGLYPHVQKTVTLLPEIVPLMEKQNEIVIEHILKELNITGDVIAIYPYGSRVYGTATKESDHDYIIVMKSSMLASGAFRDNAISNADWSIQGVVYSRGGFKDAINNYEIAALECLSLDPSQIKLDKWKFEVGRWDEKAMVKAIIKKASDSRHLSNMQSKSGNKDRAIKSMFHSLRILHFGLQLKEHHKIVNFQECNGMYEEFMKINPENFDSRNYFRIFDELLIQLRK